MPTRPRKPTDPPEAERPGEDEEEPIEILEVGGVDETTGAVKNRRERGDAASVAPAAPQGRRASEQARQLDEALREKDKYYDLLLRKQAEFDNFRKRMDREREEAG